MKVLEYQRIHFHESVTVDRRQHIYLEKGADLTIKFYPDFQLIEMCSINNIDKTPIYSYTDRSNLRSSDAVHQVSLLEPEENDVKAAPKQSRSKAPE